MNSNFEHQQAAFDKLSKLRAGALFMQMGTGKTKVALDLVKAQEENIDVVIWIAPASLLRDSGYRAEINRWYKSLKPIVFCSIESISGSDYKYLDLRKLAELSKNFCVVDESITIKNTDAGRTKRLLSMWNLFDFRLILNGTPLTQGLIDLYSQIQFLHPRILNMTEAQFANNFLTYKKDGSKPWKRWSRPENEEALIEMIRPYIFDCELDIPVEIKEYDKIFDLDYSEQNEYQEFKQDFLADKFEVKFLEAAQKFQHKYSSCREKLAYLQKIVPTLGKVIIYVKFIDEVKMLQKMFDCVVLTGSQKDDLEQFRKDVDVLICTYGVGSMGWKSITLPAGHTWKSYCYFLLNTLDEKTRRNYEEKLNTSIKFWREKGGAVSEQTIKELSKISGIENKGKVCKTSDKDVITFEDYPDDLNVTNFREVPTYKRMCVCILKNDYFCKYMGFAPTKQEMERKKQTLEMYRGL